MIYITGDCHCNFERFNMENFSEQKEYKNVNAEEILLYEQLIRIA